MTVRLIDRGYAAYILKVHPDTLLEWNKEPSYDLPCIPAADGTGRYWIDDVIDMSARIKEGLAVRPITLKEKGYPDNVRVLRSPYIAEVNAKADAEIAAALAANPRAFDNFGDDDDPDF